METSQKEVAGLNGQSKSTIINWKNAYLSVGLLILIVVLFGQVLNLLNGDYSRLAARIDRMVANTSEMLSSVEDWAEMGLANLGNTLENLFNPEEVQAEATPVTEEEPTWKVMADSASKTGYEWEMPEYTKEIMADPSLHVPAQEEVSQFTEEGVTFPDYVQKEYEVLDTWVLNTQDVRDIVWLDMTNSSHTGYDWEGKPVMVEFYEWRIGVWGTPYSFELRDSETPGLSQLLWIDSNGLNHVELIPLGSFIKIAYGTGAIYFYQDYKGLPIFTYPTNGYPLFQVEFIMMEDTFESLIVDSEEAVPYGLIKPIPGTLNSMLHRKWTQQLECPLFLDESTICTSLP